MQGCCQLPIDILGPGHYPKGCLCGKVHWSLPTCASWVAAAGCTLGSSSTTNSAPCSCWAHPASAQIFAPDAGCSFHASALHRCLRRCFAKHGQGSALYRVVAELHGGHRGAQGSPLPGMGKDGPQGTGNLHEGPGRGILGTCRITVLRMSGLLNLSRCSKLPSQCFSMHLLLVRKWHTFP